MKEGVAVGDYRGEHDAENGAGDGREKNLGRGLVRA
jgi:hypothetical protein